MTFSRVELCIHFIFKSAVKMSLIGYFILLASCFGCQGSVLREATLSNKHLTVAAEPWPPLLVINKDINGKDTYSGLIWDFMEYIQEARNCTFRIVRPHDGQWGYCFGKNNCSGMIGQVNRKEVDFAIGLMSIKFIGFNMH